MSAQCLRGEDQIARLLPFNSSCVRVAIFGSVDLHGADSEALGAAIGRALAQLDLPLQVTLVTGANAAAHRAVSEPFHTSLTQNGASMQAANARVFHLSPGCYVCPFVFGTVLPAGDDWEQRRQLLTKYCDVAISIEGGPGTADEIRLALLYGRVLLPLRRTGAASNGQFGAPQVERHAAVSESDWALLGDAAAAVEDTASALVRALVAVFKGLAEAPSEPVSASGDH
jgi:predicted Rossmann-fold nucleotide-binding protein